MMQLLPEKKKNDYQRKPLNLDYFQKKKLKLLISQSLLIKLLLENHCGDPYREGIMAFSVVLYMKVSC